MINQERGARKIRRWGGVCEKGQKEEM